MLYIEALTAGYGAGTVLHGVTLTVPTGTVHAVVGHNGAGKTTLLHAIAGLIRPTAGRVHLDSTGITGQPAHRVARAGVALVPQGRRVFASLTVAEHLTLARSRRPRAAPVWTTRRVLDLLPGLQPRLTHRGGYLSGGEQQMLAIARALLTQPRLLLLDEPTEGLAPTIAERVRQVIAALAAQKVTVLLATPHLALATALADDISVLAAGRVVANLDGDTARADPARLVDALTPTASASRPAECGQPLDAAPACGGTASPPGEARDSTAPPPSTGGTY